MPSVVELLHRIGCLVFGHHWMFRVTRDDGTQWRMCALCGRQKRIKNNPNAGDSGEE